MTGVVGVKKQQTSNRIAWIDCLRGIGIILVVIGHCYLPQTIRNWIYSFHMPLFFFIGGLTLKFDGYNNHLEFIKKKAKALLFPYLIINLTMIPTWIYFNKIVGDSEVGFLRLLYGIIYSNNDNVPLLCGPSWFLPTLFLAEVVLYFLYHVSDKKENLLAIWCFAMAVLGYAEAFVTNRAIRAWHFASVPLALIFVFLGYVFAQKNKFDKYQSVREKVSWSFIAFIFVAGSYIQYVNGKVSFGGNNYKSFIMTLTAAILLIFAFVFISIKINENRMLVFAGTSSIVWLTLHKSILFWIRLHWPSTKGNYISSVKGMMLQFAIMIPLGYIINKYFPFYIGKSFFGKVNRIACGIFIICTAALIWYVW